MSHHGLKLANKTDVARPSLNSNDYCEFDNPSPEGFKHYFPTYDSLPEYYRKKFKNWNGKKDKKKNTVGKSGKKAKRKSEK